MALLEKQYELAPKPPAPLAWDAYSSIVTERWAALLASDPAESEVQSFLEQHPCLLPGAFSMMKSSGHWPQYCSVIAQAPLPSYDKRIPDFIWLSRNSEIDQPVLIEIEAPGKRWWTVAGVQTSELTQAMNQIAEWKSWFAVPHNVQAFRSFYRMDGGGRTFKPEYVLIYGRRAEANRDLALTAKRAHLRAEDVEMMTYDRLCPSSECRELFCVRFDAGKLKAVSVPATMTWRPLLGPHRNEIAGKEAAILANPYLGARRIAFLRSRAGYWDDLADRNLLDFCDVGDAE